MADRLVSHWECGVRTPTGFNLYCWADALQSRLIVIPKRADAQELIQQLEKQLANDNSVEIGKSANENQQIELKEDVRQANNQT